MNQPHQRFARIRRELHRHPELSNQETATAGRILNVFESLKPDETFQRIGGTGLAFIFNGADPGPTTLIRCELDALPIQEANDFPHRSRVNGVSHKCGHDGHMAIVCALGDSLARQRPQRGRVICFFQPAEETGAGAIQSIEDPLFKTLHPDFAFALHNMPGTPFGQVRCKAGPFACASRGMIIRLKGKSTHAAYPEDGISPAKAMCRVIEELNKLPDTLQGFNMVTVVHAAVGEVAFGVAPEDAVIMATLRTPTDESMTTLVGKACTLVEQAAGSEKLEQSIEWDDIFHATINTEAGYQRVMRACHHAGVDAVTMQQAFRCSEDFGKFTENCEGAIFALGTGNEGPQLHNPDYDFPDQLIPVGLSVFRELITQINGLEAPFN